MQQLTRKTNEGWVKFQPGFKKARTGNIQLPGLSSVAPVSPLYIGSLYGALIQTCEQGQSSYFSARSSFDNVTGWVSSVASSLAQIPQGKPASSKQRALLTEQGGYISASEAAVHLSCSVTDIEAKRSQGELIGILTGNGYVYPAWQFDNGAVLKGLSEILEILKPFDSWMKLSFMLRKSERLNDSPLNALRKHRFDDVKSIASIYGEQGAI